MTTALTAPQPSSTPTARTRTALRFPAMGSRAHLVVDGPPALAEVGRVRIEQLERRWSRFVPGSEISRLNLNAGRRLVVSDDTVLLVQRAIEAWRLTGGTFDPTVLGDVIRAGYDRSLDELPADAPAPWSPFQPGCTDIRIEGNEVTFPAGTGFDPGGIGKGLAADIVATELRAAGARAVCVNLGGDVRVSGRPDGEAGWTIAVEHPDTAEPLALVGLADGAVTTSTTLLRRWRTDGILRHHLIDPFTGQPAETDLELVSVVAGEAWFAEILAKAVLLRGSAHPFDLIDGTGPEALAVGTDGSIRTSAGFGAFVGDRGLPTARITSTPPSAASEVGLLPTREPAA
jgi:FAD:protein FMN transferase